MKIALDYDGTVTESFELWSRFVRMFRSHGHDIRIVTFRSADQLTSDMEFFQGMTENEFGWKIPIIFTGRTPKYKYVTETLDWRPDIWIDDAPALIEHPDGIWSQDKLDEWSESLRNRVVAEPRDTEGS